MEEPQPPLKTTPLLWTHFNLTRDAEAFNRFRTRLVKVDSATGEVARTGGAFVPIGVGITGAALAADLHAGTFTGGFALTDRLLAGDKGLLATLHVLLTDPEPVWQEMSGHLVLNQWPAFVTREPSLNTLGIILFLRACWASRRWVGTPAEHTSEYGTQLHTEWMARLRHIADSRDHELAIPIQILRWYEATPEMTLESALDALDVWLKGGPPPSYQPMEGLSLTALVTRSATESGPYGYELCWRATLAAACER